MGGAGRVREAAEKVRRAVSSAWFGALLILAAVVLLVLFGRPPDPPATKGRPEGAGDPARPGFHFRDIRLVGRSRGEKQWELSVATVSSPKGEGQVDFYFVRRGIVFRENEPYLSLTADGGVYYPEQNNFIMKGNIVVSRPNGDLLRAEELQWNPVTRQVTSTRPVEAKVEGAWFRANRFSVDVASETMVAAGEVELVKEDGERLSGDTIIYSLADGSWEIQGTAELSIRIGEGAEPFVAPGLGGGGPRDPVEEGEEP